ncbi:Alpha/beta hydrolase family [Actinokineospora diospyrosa]|uniref:Alpha/beta hydrolase family n=1 Tax=Actinokineospora diospyrosa TaxID=103728 RepID=A0ABT1IHS4_9PSEU|nr:Alpha/beta hydrolase family [Actinokineospora diospyrosa]
MIARAHGSGDPRTLIVPGLGATAGEARIPASGLPGTRIVLTLPSHADAADASLDYWHYPTIAADVRSALDGVRQAIGVSLGAAALSNLVSTEPDVLDRLVLMLPAALTQPRPSASAAHVLEMSTAALNGDRARLRALVAADAPGGLDDYVNERTDALLRLGPALAAVATQIPVPDPMPLTHVTAEVLIVAATGDLLHPLETAQEAAVAFPKATMVQFDSPAPMVTHRRELRSLLSDFLGVPSAG